MKKESIRTISADTTVEQFNFDVMKLTRTEAFALVDAIAAALPSWEKDLSEFVNEAAISEHQKDDAWTIQRRLFFSQRVDFGKDMIKEIKEAFDDK